MVADNLRRLLARNVPRYGNAAPGRIWRYFPDAAGTVHIASDGVTCAPNRRSRHPC